MSADILGCPTRGGVCCPDLNTYRRSELLHGTLLLSLLSLRRCLLSSISAPLSPFFQDQQPLSWEAIFSRPQP